MEEAELTAKLDEICTTLGINVEINPTYYEIKSPAAIDVEHDEEGNLVGIGVFDGTNSYYFTHVDITIASVLVSCPALIAHNGVSDFDLLRSWGIPLRDDNLIWDTFLIGHIIDSSLKTYGLKDMAARELGITYPSYSDIVGKPKAKERRTLDKWPVKLVAQYNALDCIATYKLWEKQRSANENLQASDYFEQIEKPVSKVFANMETRGIRLDLPYLNQLKAKLEAQREPIKAGILKELGEINLNSPKQLLGALNAKGIQPTLKGKPSTDKRALGSLAKSSHTVDKLLCYSELDTLLTSFVYPYLERGTEVVHPRFSQTGTRTGRPSCGNPNLLQIPKRTDNGKLVRRMFIPRDGMLLGDCDFGQIEPRVLAHLSKDPVLCQMFNDGVDFHEFTADRLSIDRNRAKVLNLSVGYRATFKSVSQQLKCTEKEAQNEINKWWSLFPTLRRWQEGLIYDSKRSGFCTTLLGRRIKVDGLQDGSSWKRESAERQLLNNITQGSAAEIMKMAMIGTQKRYDSFSPSFGLLIQVYDELVFESSHIEHDSQAVVYEMENAVKLDVPLTVECKIGPNWADVK